MVGRPDLPADNLCAILPIGRGCVAVLGAYPMLHGLEKKGCLVSRHERAGRHVRRGYEITGQGRVALTDAKVKVRDLFGELIEGK